jgi:hypothetical protein
MPYTEYSIQLYVCKLRTRRPGPCQSLLPNLPHQQSYSDFPLLWQAHCAGSLGQQPFQTQVDRQLCWLKQLFHWFPQWQLLHSIGPCHPWMGILVLASEALARTGPCWDMNVRSINFTCQAAGEAGSFCKRKHQPLGEQITETEVVAFPQIWSGLGISHPYAPSQTKTGLALTIFKHFFIGFSWNTALFLGFSTAMWTPLMAASLKLVSVNLAIWLNLCIAQVAIAISFSAAMHWAGHDHEAEYFAARSSPK